MLRYCTSSSGGRQKLDGRSKASRARFGQWLHPAQSPQAVDVMVRLARASSAPCPLQYNLVICAGTSLAGTRLLVPSLPQTTQVRTDFRNRLGHTIHFYDEKKRWSLADGKGVP